MNNRSFTATIAIPAPAHRVFECISDVSKWWGGPDLEGRTRRPNDEFTITHGDLHYSKQRVMEIVPNRRIVWLITESRMGWLERNKSEWTNTRLVFEIAAEGNGSVLHFAHDGLVPENECYSRCAEGWNLVIRDYLFKFVVEGTPHFSRRTSAEDPCAGVTAGTKLRA